MRWRNLLVLLAAGCAYGSSPVPGQPSVGDGRGSMGNPPMGRGYSGGRQALWFSKLPYGRENWAAVVDPNGPLVSFDQGLTRENIARLQPDSSTAENVLDI